jgi:hypothetical protein
MHTDRTENELTIQETPGCVWFLGAGFAIIGGMLTYGTLGGFSNWNEVSRWELVFAFVIGLSVIFGGIWTIRMSPISKVVINRTENIVILSRRGLFVREKFIYNFDEIKHFCQIEDVDSEDCAVWYFGLELKTGEILKITSIAIHSEDFQRKYVFESNEFARKSLPTWEPALEIDKSID